MRIWIAFVLFLILTSSSHARCQIERYRFFYGSDASTTWTVTGGGLCTTRPGAGRGGGIESIEISQPPQHGVARASGKSVYPQVDYKPKDGFKGTDQFTFSVVGGGRRLQGTSNIHVTVEVR